MSRLPELKGKKVTVVGLARSGLAAARLCLREGAALTVTDARPAAALEGALAGLDGACRSAGRWGATTSADFTGADLVVVSPGVPLAAPRPAGRPRRRRPGLGRGRAGRPLPARHAPGGHHRHQREVHHHRADRGALRPRTAPPSSAATWARRSASTSSPASRAEVVVAELSSFQLEGIERLRAKVAAVLNLTPDHLDRYDGLDAYAAAKARLFATQQPGDFAVANARDPATLAMAGASRGALYTFGFGPPARAAARAPEAEGSGPRHLWFYRYASGSPERYRLDNRALRGRHNLENAMAAVLCARLLGVPGAEVQHGLDAFGGLPHRLELVRERGGVEWVNDSKATNVDSTIVGLAAFPAGAPRVVLLMGGRGKQAPYAPLRPLFAGAGQGAAHPRRGRPGHRARAGRPGAPPRAAARWPGRWRARGRPDRAGRRGAALAGLRQLRPVQGLRGARRRLPPPGRGALVTRPGWLHLPGWLARLRAALAGLGARLPGLRQVAPRPGERAAPIAPRQEPLPFDWLLLVAVLVLAAGGSVMVYSASAIPAARQLGDEFFFLKRQAFALAGRPGAAHPGAQARLPAHGGLAYPLLGLSFLALVAVLIPGVGRVAGGARRWIHLGVLNFQPAELAKVVLVLYLAHSLARKREKVRLFSIGFLPHLVVTGLLVVLCLLERDIGTGVIMVLVLFTMLFAAGSPALLPGRRRAAGHPHRLAAHRRHALPHGALAGLPRPLGPPPRHRLPAGRVAARHRQRRARSARGWARARASSSTCRRPTPTSSPRSSPRRSACSASAVLLLLYGVLVWRGLRAALRAGRAVRRLPGARAHHALRRPGPGQPGGGLRAPAHQGAHPALRLLRRQLAHDPAGRGRRPALGLRRPRAASCGRAACRRCGWRRGRPRRRTDPGRTVRMLIAGGGTGGHVFPGIALAEEVVTRHPRNDVVFVGTPRGPRGPGGAGGRLPHRAHRGEGAEGQGAARRS